MEVMLWYVLFLIFLHCFRYSLILLLDQEKVIKNIRMPNDSVPHIWISLVPYKVYRILKTIKNSMRLWKTTLEVNTKHLAQVAIK